MLDDPVAQMKVPEMIKNADYQLKNNLEARVVHLIKENFAEILEAVDANQKKAFIRWAFRRATWKILTTIQKGGAARNVPESAAVRVERRSPMAQEIVRMVVKEKRDMAPVAKLVVEHAEKEVIEAASQSAIAVPSSRHTSAGGSSFQEKEWKPPRTRKSTKRKKTMTL